VSSFGLGRARPESNDTVIVFKRTKAGYNTVGSPNMVKSNALDKLRTSARSAVRLWPGAYRILVQDVRDSYNVVEAIFNRRVRIESRDFRDAGRDRIQIDAGIRG
jgi:hypothetical protein